MGYYLGDAWPTKYTTVHVTFEGQNQDASYSKELNKVKKRSGSCMIDLCTSVSTIFLSMSNHFQDSIPGPETQVIS